MENDSSTITTEPDWRSLPSLSSLRAFELTARKGNFAAAARALNVTHAAVAQQVRVLEAELGVALARRQGRSVVLTDAGRQLAARLSDGFGMIAAGIEEVRGQQGERPVQIAATVFFSQSVVLPRLHEFWRLHPDILVSVMPSQQVADITALGIDLAIRAAKGEPSWPGLDAELLVESDVIAVGAPEMITDDMPPLDRLPWIWSEGVAHEEASIKAFGVDPARVRNADLGSPFLQIAAARRGLGLAFSPEITVREDIEAGYLRRVPVPSPFTTRYYIVTAKGPVRPQAAVFIDWLKRALRGVQ